VAITLLPPADATARDTLGGAVEVASLLPANLRSVVSQAAGEAFIDGMQLCAALSTASSLALAGFVLTMLREMRRPSDGEEVEAAAGDTHQALAAGPEPNG